MARFKFKDYDLLAHTDAGSDRLKARQASDTSQRNLYAWHELSYSEIEQATEGDLADFSIERPVWHFGEFLLTRATDPEEGGIRTWHHLIDNSEDRWCLAVPERPATTHPSFFCGTSSGPRQLLFQSLKHPFDGVPVGSTVLLLVVPGAIFGPAATALANTPLAISDAGLGALLIDYVLALEQRLPTIKDDELPRLVTATRSVVAACIAYAIDNRVEANEQLGDVKLQRACRLVEDHLDSPSFGGEELSRLLGTSRSALYRLFEPLGGVIHYIQHQRLVRAHELLSDPANVTPIYRIAEGLCFYDASSFSRAFRQEFGLTPRAVRAEANCGSQSCRQSAAAPISERLWRGRQGLRRSGDDGNIQQRPWPA